MLNSRRKTPWPGSPAWIGRWLAEPDIGGSNPSQANTVA